MINTFIAYDDNDFELGEYFEDSHGDISAVVVTNALITNLSIRGLDCTEANINNTLLAANCGRFIFIALTHGNDEELVSHEVYVSVNNSATFANSLFYTCACSTGYILGDNLINAGCLSFIGYFDTVLVNVDYFPLFFACQNFGIKTFLSHDETIEVSYNKMIEYYNKEIDRLVIGSTDDVIAASSLINNRDCLVLLGSKTLTRNDFN